MDQRRQPLGVRLELSTACQLRCPSCPTTQGIIHRHLKTQLISVENFKSFVDGNPSVRWLELSNWGEAFLHPQIVEVMRYAYEKDVGLACWNGSNMNAMTDQVLDAMVRYQFLGVTCSLDGATQATYERYRKKGSLSRALHAIDEINRLKVKLNSKLPELYWQFVVFEHNAAELQQAREMALERGMTFVPKASWDPELALKSNAEREAEAGQAHEAEWDAMQCSMLWINPQINPDGRMLGCCKNYWGDFGNIFTDTFDGVFHGEKMSDAKAMLMGRLPAKEGIPCTTCDTYHRYQERGRFVTEEQIRDWQSDAHDVERELSLRDEFKRRQASSEPVQAGRQ